MNSTIYKKTLDFGKVAYYGTRKINLVTVDVELRDTDKGIELSICGNVWNALHTDIVSGGQNIDELRKVLPRNKQMQQIRSVWKQYHLNGMNAGTVKQDAVLADHEYIADKWGGDHYNWAKMVLLTHNLLEDDGYTYGTSWLYRELPPKVIATVKGWA
jgi:hypothetical protein